MWKEFVIEKRNNLNELPDKIANSWEVCRKKRLNPFQLKSTKILCMDQLSSKKRSNQLMIDLVKEESKKITRLFNQSESLMILTDVDGYILWRQGNPRAVDYANRIGFIEGSRWNELDVGTNAISLALKNKESQMVSRFEHYAVASHDWSCFACPIFDEETLLGVLDVSTYKQNSIEQQVVVQLIVERVMNRLLRRRVNHNHALLTYLVGSDKQNLLCNEYNQIVHVPPEMEHYEQLIIGNDIQAFCQDYDGVFYTEKIHHHKELVGHKYRFYPASKAKSRYYPGVESKNKDYRNFLKQVFRAAESSLPIHIRGESGSGKEVIAQTIHFNSSYKDGPLISLNCGSISENLLESELFGYATGAFTGASKEGYLGKIRQADGGTLFLDEVDSMPLRMQAALLRVIEEKQVTPIGSNKAYRVDCRIVTATHKDLKTSVIEGLFRKDLYYRLYVCPLHIPPLRQRKEDIKVLIERFCQKNDWQIDWKDKLYNLTINYPWYGNVRELNNFLETLYIFYPQDCPSKSEVVSLIEAAALDCSAQATVSFSEKTSTANSRAENEAEQIIRALEENNYHKVNTAESLNISRTTLYRKMAKYKIESN